MKINIIMKLTALTVGIGFGSRAEVHEEKARDKRQQQY